ncbi:MAG: protein FxsA [Thermoleophilaceae bacterium]|nr:protein FxsA [Thermoleophilaceae bacterium]
MPLLALIVIFIVVPLAELYVILKVADDVLGWPLTIALLAADSLLGSWLLRSPGRAVWRRFNEAIRAGRVPHGEVIDGVLVIFGGAFLITPGFITDVIGLLLLIPPSRRVFRRLARGAIERRTAPITRAAP